MNKQKLANEKFLNGCNCAQATLSALAADKLDEKTLQLIASAFGGGIAQQGKTCGAVTGALMALGLNEGYDQSSKEAGKPLVNAKANEFIGRFIKENGSDYCEKLINYNVGIPEERKLAVQAGVFTRKCPLYVESAVKIMENLLNDK